MCTQFDRCHRTRLATMAKITRTDGQSESIGTLFFFEKAPKRYTAPRNDKVCYRPKRKKEPAMNVDHPRSSSGN